MCVSVCLHPRAEMLQRSISVTTAAMWIIQLNVDFFFLKSLKSLFFEKKKKKGGGALDPKK